MSDRGIVDLHCHCLPGLDDGPVDIHGALALCRKLAAEGVITAAATPHQLGRYEGKNEPREIRVAVEMLNRRLREEGIALTVLPAADVRLSEDVPGLLACDRVMTLGDHRRWVLLEFADHGWLDIGPLLQRLSGVGMRAIITHPERYAWDDPKIAKLWQWRRTYRAQVQITAGSLLGAFGERVAELSWHWLGHGLVDVVASDAHDVDRRPPRLRDAWDAMTRRVGDAVAMRVMCTTPARLLNEKPVPLAAQPAAMSGA